MAHFLDDADYTDLIFRAVRFRNDAYKVLIEHTRFAPTIEPAAKGSLDRALFHLTIADRLDELAEFVLKRKANG